MAQPRICSLIRMKAPEQAYGYLWASGDTVPTDASEGYATGCVFVHTDGGGGTALYINEGDETSCDFNAVGSAGSGVTVDGTATTGLLLSGTMGNGINATGTFTDHVIDIQPAASLGDYKAVYIGTWGTEAQYADDGGLFRIYGKAESGGSTSAMIFTRTLTDSTSSVVGAQFYTDCDTTATGPTNVEAINCFAILNASSVLAASSSWMNGLKGAWLKVQGDATATCNGNVAPLWIDNQMSCAVGGEEYGIIATTGGTKPDAFIGFETSSSGYDQLLYFDETFNSGAGTCVETSAVPATQDARIKVYYDGTQYYIPLYK